MRIKDLQNRIDKHMKYGDPLQNDKDFRLKILFYTLGEMIRHDVYDLFYGNEENPLKSSFKVFCADAIIQMMIYLRLRGADLEGIIDLGLTKVIKDKEYEQKLFS